MNATVSFNTLFSKGSSLLHLWSYSDEEIMRNLSKDPSNGRSKPSLRIVNSKVFLFSKIPISGNKDTKGGIYGPKIILQNLCRDWQSILSNVWYLPPFLPKVPSQGVNGITVEVMAGLSLETALRWGLSSATASASSSDAAFSAVYYPKLKPKRPKPLFADGKPFEKLAHEPPKEMIFHQILYPDSDEDTATGDVSAEDIPSRPNNRSRRGEDKEENSDTTAAAAAMLMVEECPWGHVLSLGKVHLEIVYKYCHDIPSQTTAIRDLFVTEVETLIHHLGSNTNWSLTQIRIPSSSTSSPDDSRVSPAATTVYSLARLRTGDKNLTKSFQRRLSKVGLCWIDGVALLVDPSNGSGGAGKGKLSFERFLNVNSELPDDEDEEEGEGEGEEDDPTAGSHRPGGSSRRPPQDWLGSELERIVCGLTASNEIKGLLQSTGKVYLPITLRFNLLSMVRGLEIAGPALTSQRRREALLSSEKKQLTIGKPETVARLVSSTLWMTEEGAKQVWSCCQERQSLIACCSLEARRHLESAKQYHLQGQHLEAYERLSLSVMLSQQTLSLLPQDTPPLPPPDLTSVPAPASVDASSSVSSSPYQRLTLERLIPNVLRMRHGLPGLTQDILHSITAVKELFQSGTNSDGTGPGSGTGTGPGFASIDTLSLAFTITRQICHKTRLVLMSSQCVHHSGGSALILLRLNLLEEVLHLGHWPLLRMRSINPNHSMKKLQKGGTSPAEEQNPLPWLLPEYIPRATVGVSEVAIGSPRVREGEREGRARSYHPSGSADQQQMEYEFSQVLSSAVVVIQNKPHSLLSEIEAYLLCLSLSLSQDVHQNSTRDNRDLSLVLSAKEMDSSLQTIINQRTAQPTSTVQSTSTVQPSRIGRGNQIGEEQTIIRERGRGAGVSSMRAVAAVAAISGQALLSCVPHWSHSQDSRHGSEETPTRTNSSLPCWRRN
jgi:hypothetical protein